MREQQPEDDELAFPNLKPADSWKGAWGESITKRRAAQLEAMLQEWETEQEHGERRGPFDRWREEGDEEDDRVRLSGADVFWVAARTLAGRSDEEAIAAAALDIRSQPHPVLHLEGAILGWAHLENAWLMGAHMEGAYLHEAQLKHAFLDGAHLEGAALTRAHMKYVTFYGAHLEGAVLDDAHLQHALLREGHLEGASLLRAHLEGASLVGAHLEGANLSTAHLEQANLSDAHLKGTALVRAHLEGSFLANAYLQGAFLGASHLEGALLEYAHLEGAHLNGAFFDSATRLKGVTLTDDCGNCDASMADVRWGDANLAVVDWTTRKRGFLGVGKHIDAIELGDEREARKEVDDTGKPKSNTTLLEDFKDAVRANRQLATALRQQGLNEDADRFAYKAQKLQRQVLRHEGQWLRWFGSLLLDIVAGYGYRPLRAFGAYAFVLALFTALYLINAQFAAPHLTWDEALVLSISSFHGRGFFTSDIHLSDTLARLAAGEAIIGLLIEITFIATFTQRFFAR